MRRGIALVGFMGAGKSTVGQALAARTGLPLADTDAILADRFGPIADQIARDGIAAFRARERDIVRGLCDGGDRVVATGGGTFADRELRAALTAAYRTVFLDVPFDALAERIGDGAGRPLWDADRRARYDERLPGYRQADLSVALPATADPDAWAAAIAERLASGTATVDVASAAGPYEVTLAPSLRGLASAVDRLGHRRIALVTESTVGPLWAERVRAELGDRIRAEIVVPAGEAHKDLDQWARIVDGLLRAGVDRATAVAALGGGVLGDVAGFAAAATLRGLPVVQLPTTLLAMVDSSVGGKVAVNHPLGKNLIGAFHPPALVWMAVETLSTLPAAEHRCGWGEIVKTALAVDGDLFLALEAGLAAAALADRDALAAVVARCVRAKAAIVAADERETGPRIALNAGHTLGHAIEAALGPGVVPHGEAVGIGLVAEARFAVRAGVCVEPELPTRLARLLAAAGIPGAPPAQLDAERVMAAIGVDKKAVGDKIRVPLPVAAGRTTVVDVARTLAASAVAGSPGVHDLRDLVRCLFPTPEP